MDSKSIIKSSSSSQMIHKYDVFVSFRGKDTRNNFIDHLFGAFKRKSILAFRDDTKLRKGGSISTELMQAIEGSQVLIVVFSKDYATSTWCLRELAKMVEHMKVTGQSVIPVFYDVDPSEVRKQSGDYGEAFVKHEERFKEDLEMVQRWREALAQVANLSGWDVHVQYKPQHGVIEKIVEEVINTLSHKILCFSNDLVVTHSSIEELEKLMVLDSNDDVRVVGICGMGGIGKSTLARVLYDRIYHQYDACCFIDDVSKIYEDSGPIGAQKQLLCQTLNEENQEIWNISKATYLIRTRLRHIRSIIVLDNVDKVEQLEKLGVSREWLCVGSRIIIISRDEHILKEYGVDEVYKVQPLNQDNALQLFCRKAFKCDDIIREYEELTHEALVYAEGLPLALKVLGSSLYGRDMSEWRSALARLKDNPTKEIMHVLRISFDGLEPKEKEIFLDIACFFNLYREEFVKRILGYFGFNPDIGLRVLCEKSLITINYLKTIKMHHMLTELGRKIVQEKAPNEPRKWSRLWLYEDFCKVMFEKMAIENLEAILIPYGFKTLRAEALSKMTHLRFLIINCADFSGGLNYLSNELRYLEWYKYPFIYLPSNFEPDKLVELVLHSGSIKQLWKGTKTLHNLRRIDLRHSENLTKTPDFINLPNLEKLNLEGCTKLVEINSSIELLENLVWLNLKNCTSLRKTPEFRSISNLKKLNLKGCIQLVEIHSSIGVLKKLVELNLKNCTSLMSLPNSIFGLSSLEVLNLYGCSKLFNRQLLQKGRHTEHLKKLDVGETTMQYQSTSSVSKKLMLPFRLFSSRRHKDSVGSLLPLLPSFPCLRELDLSFCNILKIPNAIGCLLCLETLNLVANKFVTLPCSIMELPRLDILNLQYCKELKYLFEDTSCNVLPARRELSGNYVPGLYMFNCPKLVEMESLSSMVISWMLQLLKVHQESPLPCKRQIEIVIPGTQIPEWFNYQSMGCSIRIDVPVSYLHDSNWIGVALCVAFVAHEHHRRHHHHPINLGSRLRFQFGKKAYARSTPVVMVRDIIAFEFDHLYVLYFPREEFIGIPLHMIKWELEFKLYFPNRMRVDVEVKNCGLRLVCKQDLEFEELNQIITK